MGDAMLEHAMLHAMGIWDLYGFFFRLQCEASYLRDLGWYLGLFERVPDNPMVEYLIFHNKFMISLVQNLRALRHVFSDFCGQIWWRIQNMPECFLSKSRSVSKLGSDPYTGDMDTLYILYTVYIMDMDTYNTTVYICIYCIILLIFFHCKFFACEYLFVKLRVLIFFIGRHFLCVKVCETKKMLVLSGSFQILISVTLVSICFSQSTMQLGSWSQIPNDLDRYLYVCVRVSSCIYLSIYI